MGTPVEAEDEEDIHDIITDDGLSVDEKPFPLTTPFI